MALSANAKYRVRPLGASRTVAIDVKTSSVVYDGSFCSFDTTVGDVKPFDGTKTDRVAGFHSGDSVTGNTSADNPPKAKILIGPFMLEDVAVAGLSTTLSANIGAPVWTTDDGTFTITDPSTTGFEFGTITRNKSTGKADVYVRDVFGKIEP